MSNESFAEFARSINTDEALRAAMTERFGDGTDIPADELIDFADAHGYTFSVREAEDQLSDEALEGVAGGGTTNINIGIGELQTNFEEIKVTYVKYDSFNKSFNLYMKY